MPEKADEIPDKEEKKNVDSIVAAMLISFGNTIIAAIVLTFFRFELDKIIPVLFSFLVSMTFVTYIFLRWKKPKIA